MSQQPQEAPLSTDELETRVAALWRGELEWVRQHPRLCLKSQETEMWPRNSLSSVQSPTINGKEFCDGKAL